MADAHLHPRPAAAPARYDREADRLYRPEDLSLDEAVLAAGNVRLCGNNTGRDAARDWGETICITDGTLAGAPPPGSAPQAQLLVPGSPEINMPDNIAYQPHRGNSTPKAPAGSSTPPAPTPTSASTTNSTHFGTILAITGWGSQGQGN